MNRKARAYLLTGDPGYASRKLRRGKRRACFACVLSFTGPTRNHTCHDDHPRSAWRESRGEDTGKPGNL